MEIGTRIYFKDNGITFTFTKIRDDGYYLFQSDKDGKFAAWSPAQIGQMKSNPRIRWYGPAA